MNKIFLSLILAFSFSYSASENDTCFVEFDIPSAKSKNNKKISVDKNETVKFLHVCINGYSYVETGDGLSQQWEIINADKGEFIPRTCNCELMEKMSSDLKGK